LNRSLAATADEWLLWRRREVGEAIGRGGSDIELQARSRSCFSAQANHRTGQQRVDIINYARECQGSIHGINALHHFIINAVGSSMIKIAVVVIK